MALAGAVSQAAMTAYFDGLGGGGAGEEDLERATDERTVVLAVFVVHAKARKEPWCLATSLAERTARDVVTLYGKRFLIEEANQGSKRHLGFEQPQGWSRRAVERTAPMAMLLYSLLVLWFGQVGYRLYRPLVRPWYRHKRRSSFADLLTTLRRACLRAEVVRGRRLPKPFHNLLETLAIAA